MSLTQRMRGGHHVEAHPESHRVRVSLGGVVLAESDRPLVLNETGLPARYYLPREDVQMELLQPTQTRTHCPFKGDASYWAVTVDGVTHPDLVWCYEDPLPAVASIAGYLCFYDERLDVEVDGVRREWPTRP
jgi:uncharacterized protein (DUF427 family)